MKLKTKDITHIAVFTAILCVFSVICVPVGVVPVTLGLFGVLIISIILGAKKGIAVILVYMLCGFIGLPVFGGFRGGIQVLTGPTGGYLISYLFVSAIVGYGSEKSKKTGILFLITLASLLISYMLGTVHFMIVTSNTFKQSLILCVYPFVVFDVLKCIIAVFLGNKIKKTLN